jgi:hypothetical protein
MKMVLLVDAKSNELLQGFNAGHLFNYKYFLIDVKRSRLQVHQNQTVERR